MLYFLILSKSAYMDTNCYYKQNSMLLLEKYNQANMTNLYLFFDKYFEKGSNILDIGFGSGRDLIHLDQKGFNISGIDPVDAFLNNIKKTFPNKISNFYKGSLPSLIKKPKIRNEFDAIICIAVWMHLEYSDYEESVTSISKISKYGAILIISYSKGNRNQKDNRTFFDVDFRLLLSSLKKNDFYLIEQNINNDSLSRDELIWETLILRYLPKAK